MDAKISTDKKARVLTSAESVFLQQGYGRTTMGDLAGAAGMSRPALYLLYPRKHELFSSIIKEEADGRLADRGREGEAGLLQHWMVWVCDLWLGERRKLFEAQPAGERRPYQRADAAPKDSVFLQSVLENGLADRAPRSVGAELRTAAARVLTYCVCGLLESDLEAAQRRRLLAFQVEALAQMMTSAPRPTSTAL